MYVGDVFCGEVKYQEGKDDYTVDCRDAVGGTVKVVQNDDYLTLCEVQVFGTGRYKRPVFQIFNLPSDLKTILLLFQHRSSPMLFCLAILFTSLNRTIE